MASDPGDDPDLQSLRSAVLASLKTKPDGATSNATEAKERMEQGDKEGGSGSDEEEEDLHALRLAALKTKREDGEPKVRIQESKPAATFERKGNLISIQIVDPEEERRKAEEEKIARAKAEADQKAEAGKAAKPTRFQRVESDSGDEEDASESSESEMSEDNRSLDSNSSRSRSASSSSSHSSASNSSSSSSRKSSSESSSSSSNSSSSQSESSDSESDTDSDDREKKSSQVTRKSNKEPERKNRRNSSEVKTRTERIRRRSPERKARASSRSEKRSVKNRLGKRLPERRLNRRGRLSENNRSSGQTIRGEARWGERHDDRRGGRGDRVGPRRTSRDSRRIDGASRSNREVTRTQKDDGDLRDRLKPDSKRPPVRGHLGSGRNSRGQSHDRRELRRSPVRSRSSEVTGRRLQPYRTHEPISHESISSNHPVRDPVTSRRPQDHSSSSVRNNVPPAAENCPRGVRDANKNGRNFHSKRASDSESLSDIPLESEEEKELDNKDARFRKRRQENDQKGKGDESPSNSQSRLVMSLTLPTDSEMKKADEKQLKDFKRRREMDEIRNRHRAGSLNSGRTRRSGSLNTGRVGKVNSRTKDTTPQQGMLSSPENSGPGQRKRNGEDSVRRIPKPSDFVSETDSGHEKSAAAIRSQVTGSGDTRNAKEALENRRRKESESLRPQRETRERVSSNRKGRKRRQDRGRRRAIRNGSRNEGENGEEIVQKLSIRDRLGDPPVISTLGSSMKSRLGPKVSSPERPEEPGGLEIPGGPKKRRIKVLLDGPDQLEDGPGAIDEELEGRPDVDHGNDTLGGENILTTPDDLRHKVKKKLKRKDKELGGTNAVEGLEDKPGKDDHSGLDEEKVVTQPDDLRHKMKKKHRREDKERGGASVDERQEELHDRDHEINASGEEGLLTRPDDLRHKMKRQFKRKDKDQGDSGIIDGIEERTDVDPNTSKREDMLTRPDDLRHKMKRKLKRKDRERGEGDQKGHVKRKVTKKKDGEDTTKEKSNGRSSIRSKVIRMSKSPSRERDRERNGTRRVKKPKADELLEAKMKRMQEMNAAIMERHRRVQREKEMFDF